MTQTALYERKEYCFTVCLLLYCTDYCAAAVFEVTFQVFYYTFKDLPADFCPQRVTTPPHNLCPLAVLSMLYAKAKITGLLLQTLDCCVAAL